MEHCDEGAGSTSNEGLRAVAASSMQFLRSSCRVSADHLTPEGLSLTAAWGLLSFFSTRPAGGSGVKPQLASSASLEFFREHSSRSLLF
jgi:hypothetical protein